MKKTCTAKMDKNVTEVPPFLPLTVTESPALPQANNAYKNHRARVVPVVSRGCLGMRLNNGWERGGGREHGGGTGRYRPHPFLRF